VTLRQGPASPFAGALRAAIQASGLSLDRLQHRLRERGVTISVATLSYWQSGRSQPQRSQSLVALRHLEEPPTPERDTAVIDGAAFDPERSMHQARSVSPPARATTSDPTVRCDRSL
jgi:hypothetical protein